MYTIDYDINELFNIDSELLKSSFLKIINLIDDDKVVEVIKSFATIKPIIKFKVIFDILEEFSEYNNLNYDFNILRGYINKDIDIFMLSNCLTKKDNI